MKSIELKLLYIEKCQKKAHFSVFKFTNNNIYINICLFEGNKRYLSTSVVNVILFKMVSLFHILELSINLLLVFMNISLNA